MDFVKTSQQDQKLKVEFEIDRAKQNYLKIRWFLKKVMFKTLEPVGIKKSKEILKSRGGINNSADSKNMR